jgi:drug/metabolite transporter (DMT)-like permease
MNADAKTARLALIALLAGAVGIGFAPIFVRLSEIGPVATAFHRLFLSLPLFFLWMNIEPKRGMAAHRPTSRLDWLLLAGAGLFFCADLSVWHWSIGMTSVANATLLPNFAPILVALGGYIFLGHRFRPLFLVGLGTAVVGAAILMGESFSLSAGQLAGDALALLAAFFYAGYILAIGRLRTRFSTATIMSWSGIFCSAGLFAVAAISGEGFIAPSLYGWLVLLGLALFSHLGGQGLIAYGLAHLPAAFGSVTLLLQPVVAAILAWCLFAEALSIWQGIGSLVILAGIVLARKGS